MKFYYVYVKNSETEKLKNAYLYLKYYNSNKFQYFWLKIQPTTLKIWHFKEKISTIGYGPKRYLFCESKWTILIFF